MSNIGNEVTRGAADRFRALRALPALSLAAAIGAAGLPTLAHAQTSSGVALGVLSCNEASGWGFVFGSSHSVRCTFSTGNGHVERYTGSISKFGVDVGYQQSGVLVWGVLAPTGTVGPGALQGHYGGVVAGAAVGVGAGAQALVGGSTSTITLQPLSIEGVSGVNVAAGIGELTLRQAE